jgi:predicted nucleic acid-binding protein
VDKALLDTDIFSEVLKGIDQNVIAKATSPMIAAIALRHSLTLVTGNLSHYQRIQALGYGLKLDNWRV